MIISFVSVSPSHVTISGPSEARVGDPVPLSCSTAPSNPAADIKWLVLGKHHKEASNRTVISPEGKSSFSSGTKFVSAFLVVIGLKLIF